MTAEQIIKNITEAVESFNASVPGIEQSIMDDLTELLGKLDIRNRYIQASAKNIRLIGAIKNRINRIVLSDEYKKNVKQFSSRFREIERMQNEFFRKTLDDYSAPKVLLAIREDSVTATVEALTDIERAVTKPIQDILRVNITSGARFSDMMNTLRQHIMGNEDTAGVLGRYVKQITTDKLNQYARQNIATITNDLGLQWFRYAGGLIDGSRDFCRAMHEKKYFHISEIPNLIKGDFDEYDGEINDKTGLPQGMIAGTNEDNFLINLGGYMCQHQAIPVPDTEVPAKVRAALRK
jgi:hypothetical protein